MKRTILWISLIFFVGILLPPILISLGDYLTYGVRIEEDIRNEPQVIGILGKTYEVIRGDLFLQKEYHDSQYYLDYCIDKVIKRDELGKETEQIANTYEVAKNVEKGFRFTVAKVTVRKTVFGERQNRFHVYAALENEGRLIKNVDVSFLFERSTYSSEKEWIFIPKKGSLQEINSENRLKTPANKEEMKVVISGH